MSNPTTHEMGNRHEAFLQRLFGGRRMKGSGNQQSGQMDGRHDAHRGTFAFAWDGKSTFGKSLSVSKDMWAKAVRQSHFERPMIPLRFYDNYRLQDSEALDLVVVSANDMAEVLERLHELEGMIERAEELAQKKAPPTPPPSPSYEPGYPMFGLFGRRRGD